MTNGEYLVSLAPEMPHETMVKCLIVMERYGENRWWLNEDKRVLAYYQLHEPTLLVEFSDFHAGVEALLGHSVFTHEFAAADHLRAQAQKAFEALSKGGDN